MMKNAFHDHRGTDNAGNPASFSFSPFFGGHSDDENRVTA